MSKGKIVKSGGMELGDEIEEQGYGKLQARI
jgi:Fe-S cluster assembly ATPase SufC